MNGPKLTIPQIADEFKNRISKAPDGVYMIDYSQAEELSGWTLEEMDNYKRGSGRGSATFYDDVATSGMIIHVSIYFGYKRILSEMVEQSS